MNAPLDPMVVAVEMGYGHLRPARSIALTMGVPLMRAERAPLCDAAEAKQWDRIRGGFDTLVRASQLPVVGQPFDALLRGIAHLAGDPDAMPAPVQLLGVRVIFGARQNPRDDAPGLGHPQAFFDTEFF